MRHAWAAGGPGFFHSTSKLADVSDTAILRLVTQPNGEVVVVPVIR